MDWIQKYLFGIFPREVGIPYRITVWSEDEFDKHIISANHIKPVYVSVYDKTYNIDKAVIDIDSRNISTSYTVAKIIYDKINDIGSDAIVVFSGRKGFHIYFLVDGISGDINEKKYMLKTVQSLICSNNDKRIKEYGIKKEIYYSSIDTHLFGDIKRLIRVPNTWNKTRYAVPLPYDWYDMSISDILEYSTEPKYECKKLRKPVIVDINKVKVRYNKPIKREGEYIFSVNPSGVYDFLRYMIRPCILEELMTNSNPPHYIRFNLVCELYWLGFSEWDICEIIKSMNWDDYNENITQYQVNHICSNGYYPDSCSTLIDKGIKCQKCGWNYWWGKYKDSDKHIIYNKSN